MSWSMIHMHVKGPVLTRRIKACSITRRVQELIWDRLDP
jgi:hypothetical protein